MIKYSVIVPVYNSEKTLARCLSSLTAKNREDVQIIVVNDGSTDSSDAIIREFTARYPQIFYICQKNAGVSQARNAGLDAAQGTYITFVDSDDYVLPNYFDVLDTAEDCDLLVFAHEQVGGPAQNDDTQLLRKIQAEETVGGRLAELLATRKIMSPCNKRFRAELIRCDHLRFLPGMHIGEDFNFCMAYAVRCKTIDMAAERILMVDVSDSNSLSRKYRPELDRQLENVFRHVVISIRESMLDASLKDKLLTVADYLFVKHVFSCISEEFKKEKLRYWKARERICSICGVFQQEFSDGRVNLIHKCLRLTLGFKWYYPLYLVSYWGKGRKYIR